MEFQFSVFPALSEKMDPSFLSAHLTPEQDFESNGFLFSPKNIPFISFCSTQYERVH
jgi:hypothetical protein